MSFLLLSLPGLSKFAEELRKQPAENFLSSLAAVPADSSLAKVIGLLGERGVYEVFLPEGSRCAMISARDVLKTTNIDATKTAAVLVYVPVLRKESSVGEVARLMADYRIRAVPISDGHKIVGQVNCLQLLNTLRGKMGGETRVTSIASKNPITLGKEASIAKARDLMIRRRIDHLPIMGNRGLEGVITSTDVMSHMSPPERVGSKSMRPETRHPFDIPVGDVMQTEPLTCSPETTTQRALDLMLTGARTYVLVTQWEEVQGIATHRDFMTLLAEPEPESEVPIFMVGLPDDPFEAEATKAKFKRTVNQLRRVFPDILEARSVIKAKSTTPGKERRRYEVKVQIRTPTDSYTYSDQGWELPAVYDVMTDRLKRLMTQKPKPRKSRDRGIEEAL